MMSFVREMLAYFRARRKWLLLPVFVLLILIGGALILAKGSALAPFVYTVF